MAEVGETAAWVVTASGLFARPRIPEPWKRDTRRWDSDRGPAWQVDQGT